AVLAKIGLHQILLLKDIDSLQGPLWDPLISAMSRYEVEIQVGSGAGARPVRLPIPHFTLIATTTRLWRLPEQFRRWCVPFEFDPYTPAEIMTIVQLLAEEQKVRIDKDAANIIAPCCKGSPGNAVVLVRRLATECADLIQPVLTANKATAALSLLGY